MSVTSPLLRKIDAVTVPVPDLDAGLRFYRDSLGHELRWRNDRVGQAGLRLPGSDTELVLTTRQAYEPGPLLLPPASSVSCTVIVSRWSPGTAKRAV